MVKSFIIPFFLVLRTRVGAWGMWLIIVRVCSTILVIFVETKKKKIGFLVLVGIKIVLLCLRLP